MKLALTIGLGFLATAALGILVLYLAGMTLPREHRSRVTATFAAGRDAVWTAITDYAAMPSWWPAVASVSTQRLPDGSELTINTDRHGQKVAFRSADVRPRELLVREIVGNNLPFGGRWTFELADAPGGGTRLTLTEDGFINPPLFRAVARWFIGLDATQKDFVAHLEKRLAGRP
jgi:uncharacterized protein YndB with AHSA1/START domain